jgi:hypothetical protein
LGVNFQPDQWIVIHSSGQIIAESAPDNGMLYELHLWSALHAMVNIAQRTLPIPSFNLLHKRLAHPSQGVLRQMIEKGLITGIPDVGNIPDVICCNACIQSKMTAALFAIGHKHADKILEHVHLDLGEFEHLSIGRCKYFGLAKNPVYHNHTKHIDICHHFIRQCVADGSIDIKLISTADNAADLFTKPLGQVKHQFFHSLIGLQRLLNSVN